MRPVFRGMFRLVAASTLVFAVSVLGPASAAQAAASPSPQEIDAKILPSIVYIGIEWTGTVTYPYESGYYTSEPVTANFTCTGWFASTQGDIVTAGHCVDPNDSEVREGVINQFVNQLVEEGITTPEEAEYDLETSGEWEVNVGNPVVRVIQTNDVPDPVVTTPTTVKVVDYVPFEQGDYALLSLPNPAKPTPALVLASQVPSVGTSITSVGYPGGVVDLADNPRVAFLSGTVSSQQAFGGTSFTQVNTNISPGLSGGPSVDTEGNIDGTNSFGLVNGSQDNFVTDALGLRRFLIGNGVPLAKASDPSGSGGLALGVILGTLVGALIIIIGAIVIVRRRKRTPSKA